MVFDFHERIFLISDFIILIGNQVIDHRKVVPTELASIFSCFTDFSNVAMCATLHTLFHDLRYRAVSFAVQISNQNMCIDFHCVEIGTQELHKVLHS
jgi:hypothetical protein